MTVALKKWGNSTGLRIPSNIMEDGHFELDQEMDIRLENGCIIVEPAETGITLAQLVENISPDNLPEEIDFGSPVGQETEI